KIAYNTAGIDFNKWVGKYPNTMAKIETILISTASYKIFAIRAKEEESPSETPPSPLLRWWDAFPPARSDAPKIPRSEVANLVRDPSLIAGKDYAIIDVRGDDHSVS